MKYTMKRAGAVFLASASLCVLAGALPAAAAETVTTRTVITQQEIPNVQQTNFMDFDLNGDGILSMSEVGEKLFYVFDTDGNQVLDNIEFTNKKVMTIIPMERQTVTLVDYDGDGKVDEKTYTYDTFVQKSHLMRFDRKMDGLSPADFIGHSFLELDDDNSKAIELGEWKEAYTEMVHPLNAEPERYNH